MQSFDLLRRLAGGSAALALPGTTIATGAILVVLICIIGPVSGAHVNPAVTLAFAVRRDIGAGDARLCVAAQAPGGIAGILAAHGRHDLGHAALVA